MIIKPLGETLKKSSSEKNLAPEKPLSNVTQRARLLKIRVEIVRTEAWLLTKLKRRALTRYRIQIHQVEPTRNPPYPIRDPAHEAPGPQEFPWPEKLHTSPSSTASPK